LLSVTWPSVIWLGALYNIFVLNLSLFYLLPVTDSQECGGLAGGVQCDARCISDSRVAHFLYYKHLWLVFRRQPLLWPLSGLCSYSSWHFLGNCLVDYFVKHLI